MVKGISKQVIVVHSPDEKLFEQAIFILNENAVGADGVTDDALMKEARRLIGGSVKKNRRIWFYGPAWACAGAMLTGLAWLLATIF